MESRLKAEIRSLEANYRLVKDFLSGADYDLNTIPENLQSLKDNLSNVRALTMAYTQIKEGKVVDFPINPIVNQIDLALTLIEMNPQQARSLLQLSLALSNVKIEDIMAFISILRDSLR